MSQQHRSCRVAVAVSPRIWGDALSVALRAHDVEVEVRSDGAGPDAPQPQYDLAVTTGHPLEGADVSVVLPSCPDTTTARIARSRGPEERRSLENLDEVLELVLELLAERAGGRLPAEGQGLVDAESEPAPER